MASRGWEGINKVGIRLIGKREDSCPSLRDELQVEWSYVEPTQLLFLRFGLERGLLRDLVSSC